MCHRSCSLALGFYTKSYTKLPSPKSERSKGHQASPHVHQQHIVWATTFQSGYPQPLSSSKGPHRCHSTRKNYCSPGCRAVGSSKFQNVQPTRTPFLESPAGKRAAIVTRTNQKTERFFLHFHKKHVLEHPKKQTKKGPCMRLQNMKMAVTVLSW